MSGRFDILLMTETKIDATFSNSQFNVEGFRMYRVDRTGAPTVNFRKISFSEDDLSSLIFGMCVVKFLACLPLLGFSNI